MTRHHPELDFRFVHEAEPGPEWLSIFREFWPSFRRWCYAPSHDGSSRPDYAACVRALREHLPSMAPVHETLCELVGGGDEEARFLSLWRPPSSIRGCAQAVWRWGDDIALVRNYDFAPRRCDGVVLRSAWSETDVIAVTDCSIGALDGMNEHGLAASLAFGGDKAVGEGFGTTMLVRAALESCATVPEAIALLRNVPVHMAYSVTLIDRQGEHATLLLSPDTPAQVTTDPAATNHQGGIAWPEYAEFSRTIERRRRIDDLLATHTGDATALAQRFLEPPLYRNEYARGSGTLYTAVYTPTRGTLDLIWPDAHIRVCFDDFQAGTHVARYQQPQHSP
ncbi:MAG: hypothetical protein H6813_07700 [Phycisphaeraceae bacterium]|nr:hypothetical protein [Phycisphaeraceae bacterium]MCB9848380.1 hypothetical protein [Phycisphaeraceae bacterium]